MKQTVLLLGATGQTGGSVLNALLAEPDSFVVHALVRPASAVKPEVAVLAAKGVGVRVVDIQGPLEPLVRALQDIDVVISTIDAQSQLAQLQLVAAAKQARVKRFVPCAFITVAPPGGVMTTRDEKEVVYQEIFKAHLPYTIIDVGYWHQISFPGVPSGRTDYARLRPIDLHGDGMQESMLIDLRDIGRYVARITQDERTLNRYMVAYSDCLSEEQVFGLTEEASGEKIERNYIPTEKTLSLRAKYTNLSLTNPTNRMARYMRVTIDYEFSKYIRGDNTPAYARYLGYLDANELYPDLRPIGFREFLVELVQGKSERAYKDVPMFDPPTE
uniref:NmrA-like domain-containing protein n=1 Tax=Mycena chlorophos TaxID=658473 RepID=A0ABQ0LCR1_MYCCL|nr:predicted protein [Mycena chlorophos]